MPDNCPCASEPRDCAACAAEAELLRRRILDAVASGKVTEEEVFRAVFNVKRADLN